MRAITVQQQASGQRLAQSSRRQSLVCRPCQSSRLHSQLAQRQQQQQQRSTACAAAAPPANPAGPTSAQATFPPGTAPPDAKLITRSEVPPFIPRDDMMDQLYHWSLIEGGESGLRNFGAAMGVAPYYRNDDDSSTDKVLWGFVLTIYREGNPLADLAVQFDLAESDKHEFLGMGPDGFPRPEGRVDKVLGKHFEIWKLGGSTSVDEDLRSSIRAYCTALVAALNRYYAFGSVFVDDAQ